MSQRIPSSADVSEIAHRVLGEVPSRVERFTTGAANYVFDVETPSGRRAVVRIARERGEAEGTIYWNQTLRPMGVPLPRIIAHNIDDDDALNWVVLERFDGTDLWHVYPQLTREQKSAIVKRVADAQRIVNSLPRGVGFGYTNVPGRAPHKRWIDVVHSDLQRTRMQMQQAGVVDTRHVDRVQDRARELESYFAGIQPIAFLDDTTTKNVIVHNGKLTGIVDVDSICYGDSLGPIALTRMSLLNLRCDTDYTDEWLELIGASREQRRAVDFYTAACCVNFLSELGQQFNRESAPAVDPAEVAHLLAILGSV